MWGVLLLAVATAATAAAENHPSTRPAAPATTQAANLPAIPLLYAKKDGKPFDHFRPEELARIIARAREMTPAGKKIWFILIRRGTWFPAAHVYFPPQKGNGRFWSGQYRIVWRKDSEHLFRRDDDWENYVWVVDPKTPAPNAAGGEVPPVPKTNWLPFDRPEGIDDKLIFSLVDKVQEYRQRLDAEDPPAADLPIMGIERYNGAYSVLVAWPDQGYEDFFIVKETEKDKGLKVTGQNMMAH
jgi:hypothetical protein